jgi:arsenite methyltransferase
MSDKNDNVAVKVVRKLVGLPTGPASSSCCGPSAVGVASPTAQADCCVPTAAGTAAGQAASAVFSAEQVHQGVRERYGEIARTRDTAPEAAGCSCTPAGAPRLYSDQELADLPTSVTELSLGCGSPVSEGDIRPGDTVLDLGSGGGVDCFLAAKRVGALGHVIGIDMTPEMLERARASATRLNATNVEFRQGQIEAMPVTDGEVDVVISNCVINLSPDKPQVFREMFRALKSGGRVSVSDIVTNGPLSPLISQDMANWAACVAGASDAQAYRDGLAVVGFVDIKVTPKEGTLNTLSARVPAGMPFSALISARKP